MWLSIVGSREFNDYVKFCKIMEFIKITYLKNIVGIVSGGANGIDSMAEKWAKENSLQLKVFHADWKKYGKAAGPIRNQQIVDFMHRMVAIPKIEPDGSYSKGTANSIKLAEKAGKICYIVELK